MNFLLIVGEYVVIFEFVIILVLIVFAFMLNIYYAKQQNKNSEDKSHVEALLKKIMYTQAKFDVDKFPKKWQNLQILVPIVQDLDLTKGDQQWKDLRGQLLHLIMLPLARKYAKGANIYDKIYATEVFNLGCDKSDDIILLELVNNKIPLVYNNAANAAIKNSMPQPINAYINKISNNRWLTRVSLSYLFLDEPGQSRDIVVEKLMHSVDPYVKATCYNILIKYPPEKINKNFLTEVTSSNVELKIAALKFLAYVDPEAAIPVLIQLLHDKHKEVKLVSLHRLQLLKATQAIPDITSCLKDHEFPVRLSAAKALISLDPNGANIIKQYDLDFDFRTPNIPHMETMLW